MASPTHDSCWKPLRQLDTELCALKGISCEATVQR